MERGAHVSLSLRPKGLRSGRLPSSGRGLLAITSGTVVAQAAALAAAPVIARIYTPADVGLFSIAAALVTTISTVAALRFELAIPLPEHEREAHALVGVGLIAVAITTLAGVVVAAVFRHQVAGMLGQPHLSGWLLLVPLMAGLVGVFSVLNQHAIREKRFAAVGRRNMLQGVVTVAAQIGAGLIGFKSGGMIAGYGVGQCAGVYSLVIGARLRSDEARLGRAARSMRAAAARYRRFPMLLTPSGLLNTLGLQLPILLIAWRYGGEVAGWLGLTQRVLALPMSLVGSAMAQVYLAVSSGIARGEPGDGRALFMTATLRLSVVACISGVVLLAFGPDLFSLVFGSEWTPSGEYARALAAALMLQMIASPLSQTLIVYERQWLQLAWDAGRLAAVTASIVVASDVQSSPLTTLWVFSSTTAMAYAVSWWLSYRTASSPGRAAASQSRPVTR